MSFANAQFVSNLKMEQIIVSNKIYEDVIVNTRTECWFSTLGVDSEVYVSIPTSATASLSSHYHTEVHPADCVSVKMYETTSKCCSFCQGDTCVGIPVQQCSGTDVIRLDI